MLLPVSPAQGQVLSVSDVARFEDTGAVDGRTPFVFTITRSDATTECSFFAGTADGTARADDQDYVPFVATQTFVMPAGGSLTYDFPIDVLADARPEGNETFELRVFGPSGCSLEDGVGVGTILEDGDDDPDRDGLRTDEEVDVHSTDPGLRDTDGDRVEDGVEVALGTDPTDPDDPADTTDGDGDGIPDGFDAEPSDPDADGDGILDGYEIAVNGSLDGEIFLGDANGDGEIDQADVAFALRVLRGLAPAPSSFAAFDVDRDGELDRADVISLIHFLRGHQSLLPVD